LIRRRSIIAALGLLLSLVAWPATGQIFRYMAFGDSITKGRLDFDPTGQGGYPGRIDDLLSCFPPDCEVINKGKDGERTNAGVTRIENVLDNQDWDIVLLMEGSNDIHVVISNETIEANLTLMDSKARNHGVDTLHASIIHLDPQSESGGIPARVAAVEDLRDRVIALAASRNRYFADPWTPLCPDQACFDAHYHNPGPGDSNTVGHPDPSGFDIMAGVFFAAIDAEPIPGPPAVVSPIGTTSDLSPTFTWDKESPDNANWYEMRLLDSVGGTLSDEWYPELVTCGASQCSVDLGSFAEGDYIWEVRGRNPRGRSAWVSTPFTIATLLPPTTPTPIAPGGVILDPEPDFEGGREMPTVADSYRLEVSDTGGVILDQLYTALASCDATQCLVDAFSGSPLAEGDYSWRVQGENAAGSGPWSSVTAFTIDFSLIFADGFESGDITAWSSSVP
jgi:lysophospholipase L1-like esterase